MKLAYSVNGEGFGHAARMVTLIPLLSRWHEVVAFAPQSVRPWLQEKLPTIAFSNIPHFSFVKRQDRIRYLLTVARAIPVIFTSIPRIISLARELRKSKFDGVISDFEPLLAWAGILAGIKVLQFNHPGIILRFPSLKPSAIASRIVAMMMEGPWHRRIHVSFFKGQLGPIIRPSLFEFPLSRGDFLLVNVKPSYRAAVHAALEKAKVHEPSLSWRIFPDPASNFDQALAACAGVISSAGHQIICESLALGKPVLAIPQDNQEEQQVNARMLVKSGGGLASNLLNLASQIVVFTKALPQLQANLAGPAPKGFTFHDCSQDAVRSISRQFLKRRERSQEIDLFDPMAFFQPMIEVDTSATAGSIAVLGCGYVGLLCSAGMAEFSHPTVGLDLMADKIAILKAGHSPIHEPGLEELIRRNLIHGTLDYSTAISDTLDAVDTIFIAVGTPPQSDGSSDLTAVYNAASTIAQAIGQRSALQAPLLVVIKSTVPVGTNQKILDHLTKLSGKRPGIDFDLASNPEFLREGHAVHDFFHPERTVIGYRSAWAKDRLSALYEPIARQGLAIVFCDPASAELSKYAANAFLAVKISFINQIANLAEDCQADINAVAEIMGMDSRIGPRFLQAGPGYGGSCFPKDTASLLWQAQQRGVALDVVAGAAQANENQIRHMHRKFLGLLGRNPQSNLADVRLALLGLSFKPHTDDVRESPSIPLVRMLLDQGAQLVVHDPVAMARFQELFPISTPGLTYAPSALQALAACHGAIVVCDWPEYKNLEPAAIVKAMQQPRVLDCRNILNPVQAYRAGLILAGTGRPMLASECLSCQ